MESAKGAVRAPVRPRLPCVSYPDQVVSGGGEREHPAHSFAAAMLGLAQTGGGLDPAEDLFDELAFLLALAIALVACGAFIDAAQTS